VARLSEAEKARIEELWRAGLPGRAIGRELGRAPRTVWDYVEVLRRRPTAPRTRAPVRLSLGEREEISRGLAAGDSLRAIAGAAGPGAVDGVAGGPGERGPWPLPGACR
jgi:transposase, IS30 family